jgi:hypothetical protein
VGNNLFSPGSVSKRSLHLCSQTCTNMPGQAVTKLLLIHLLASCDCNSIRFCGAAGAFVAGYLQNYRNMLADVSGSAYPLAKAFGQVLGNVVNCVSQTGAYHLPVCRESQRPVSTGSTCNFYMSKELMHIVAMTLPMW